MAKTYTTNANMISLLKKVFLQYWKWDSVPSFTTPSWTVEDNSPEDLLMQLYPDLKSEVVREYPWRCCQKYAKITPTTPTSNDDKRYAKRGTVPNDFLIANGFWLDEERRIRIPNSVDIIGTTIKTNLDSFTMQYTSNAIAETNMDVWLLDYMATYIACEASDIGGCNADTKNFLLQKKDIDYLTATNKDYQMAHQEEMSDTIHQYEFSF